jgi:hypothetical protein
MKQHYFVKFDPRVNQLTGCYRATLILSTLEYWFQKKPDGFYKFIEACPHRLYKSGDSWTEQLDCDRKSFASSFDKIAVRYKSRRAYEKAQDKFQEKMYASIYDRNTNQTYFVRNHELANKVLTDLFPKKNNASKKGGDNAPKARISVPFEPLRNGKNSRSYKESENTTNNLSKDKSHAEEIVKKMIELWTALVEEGRGQIELTSKRIAFLKKAFVDKFDSSLEKWKKYCQDIASSRFLMGEVRDFRATLDWVLKFENIQKIFDGNYGIGDRTPKAILSSQSNLQEEIINSEESQELKDFRILCLETVGNAKYISYFKNLTIEFRGEGEIALIAAHKTGANLLEQNFYSYLRLILQGLGTDSKNIKILAPGETRGRLIEREKSERGGSILPTLSSISVIEPPMLEEPSMEEIILVDETLLEASLKTQDLREKLRNTIPSQQFPAWLSAIEVEEIGQDGIVVVTLGDQLIVDYCKVRFSQQILACAKELWQGINYLIIQEKPQELKDHDPTSFQNMLSKTEPFPEFRSIKDDAEFLLSMVGEGDALKEGSIGGFEEVSSKTDEGSMFYQAVKSLKGMSLPQSMDRKIESLEMLHSYC